MAIPCGTVVTSYVNGKFDHESPTEGLSNECELKTVSEMVQFNGKLQMPGDVAKKQIQSGPRASIAFHKSVPQPTAEDPAAGKVIIDGNRVVYNISPPGSTAKLYTATSGLPAGSH